MNEAIVEKLHGTLSILRRERDEVHRAKELAMERLRLAKEETERMERTLQASKQKYDALMAQSTNNSNSNSNNNCSNGSDGHGGKVNESVEIMQLKKEVERIGREAKFQHMEYVSKRDTLAKLKNHLKAEDAQRSKNIRIAQETLKKRRAKLANIQALARNHISTDGTSGGSASRGRANDNGNDSGISGGAGKGKNRTSASASASASAVETQIRKVLDEDQTHGHSMTLSNGSNSTAVLDIFAKLQRCLDKKVDECANDAGTIRRNADSVQRRIRGYEDYMAQNIGMSRTSGARNVSMYGSHMSALGQ